MPADPHEELEPRPGPGSLRRSADAGQGGRPALQVHHQDHHRLGLHRLHQVRQRLQLHSGEASMHTPRAKHSGVEDCPASQAAPGQQHRTGMLQSMGCPVLSGSLGNSLAVNQVRPGVTAALCCGAHWATHWLYTR